MNDNMGQPEFRNYMKPPTTSEHGYHSQHNIFVIMSMVMGGLALSSCTFIFSTLVTGGLSILFAILSKGNSNKMQFMSKAGVVSSIAGIFLSVIITSAFVYLTFHTSEYRELLNETYEQMYGQTFDEALEEMYPSVQGGDANGNEN